MRDVKVLAQHLMDFHGYQSHHLITMTNVVIGEKITEFTVTNSVATFGSDGKIWVRDYTSEQVTKRSVLTHEAFDPSEYREVKTEEVLENFYGDLEQLMRMSVMEMKLLIIEDESGFKSRVNTALERQWAEPLKIELIMGQLYQLTTESFAMQA